MAFIKKYLSDDEDVKRERDDLVSMCKAQLHFKKYGTYGYDDEIILEPKTYEYLLTWTKAPGYTIEQVRGNIDKFVGRKDNLKLIHVDIVLEHIDSNPHFHMRVRTGKFLAKSRITYYQKFGHIDFKKIKCGDWDNVGEYMGKEGDVVTLVTSAH